MFKMYINDQYISVTCNEENNHIDICKLEDRYFKRKIVGIDSFMGEHINMIGDVIHILINMYGSIVIRYMLISVYRMLKNKYHIEDINSTAFIVSRRVI